MGKLIEQKFNLTESSLSQPSPQSSFTPAHEALLGPKTRTELASQTPSVIPGWISWRLSGMIATPMSDARLETCRTDAQSRGSDLPECEV